MQDTGALCPECGGRIVVRYGSGRRRTTFYSCENYPKCKFSSWNLPTGEKCPSCGKILYYQKSKKLLVCADKACGYAAAAPEEYAEKK